jgi:hypothetical protein
MINYFLIIFNRKMIILFFIDSSSVLFNKPTIRFVGCVALRVGFTNLIKKIIVIEDQ